MSPPLPPKLQPSTSAYTSHHRGTHYKGISLVVGAHHTCLALASCRDRGWRWCMVALNPLNHGEVRFPRLTLVRSFRTIQTSSLLQGWKEKVFWKHQQKLFPCFLSFTNVLDKRSPFRILRTCGWWWAVEGWYGSPAAWGGHGGPQALLKYRLKRIMKMVEFWKTLGPVHCSCILSLFRILNGITKHN